MEGEKRDQKLKAGKEKLAQFQRKKRKKKPRIDETGSSPPIAEATISPSANAESDPAFLLDSDTLTISSCSEDDTDSAQEWSSRAQLQLKSKLQAKSQRVEELEESLVGKQLALDKVIQENEKLKTLMKHVDHTDVSDANHNPVENMAENQNQSCYANGTVENQQVEDGSHKGTENGTGSQEFSMSDVQELLHHVQWLQLQLKQANNTLQTQNRKQKETADALLHAKEEIVLLQDSITHKDKLLNELVEKMTIISKEYGSLKQNYAQLSDSRKESLNEEIEKERNLRCEVETALKNEVQMTKSENEHKIQELLEREEERLGKVTEEYDVKIKDLESQLEEFQTRNEENKLSSEKIMNENAGLQSYCDTLTKGLEFMKEEHEKAMTELNELSVGFKVLKSEYDILVEEKGQCELQAESLKAELDTIKAEREQVLDQISSLKNVNGSLEKDIKDTCEKFERIKHEHHKLLTDNTVLADEIVKLKEDNAMYQSQIAEYEGKLSESEEIFDENHSLHGQNDELNNKINNQKDVIASIKNELEVLTMENSQYVSQMKDLSTGLQQTKKENGDLKAENEQLQSEVTNLKDMLSLLEEESLQYKDNQLVLNEEIQNLKQCLAKSSTESSAKVPLLLASKQNKIQSFETDKSEIKSDYEEHIMVNEELIVAQEVLSQSEAIPQVFIRHRVDEGDKTFKHDDADENSDSNRKLVSEGSSVSDFAKISESDNKVTELEEEIKRLNTVIIEIQASTVSKEDVTSSKKLLQNDLSNETGNKLDTMSAVSNSNDTAYESLHYEHTHLNQVETEYADSEVDVLAERLLNMQQEFKLVTQALHHKTKECEDLHHELQRLTQKQLPAIPTPTDVCGDILIDNGEKQKVSELPKVSETSSVTSLEKEVNMHASSSLCSVQNDGVVTLGTLDSLPGIMCKGDSDIYVDQDTFQNVTEDAVDETRHLDVPQKELNKMDSKEYEPEYGVPESLSKELTEIKEQIQIQEMETIKWKDAYDQMLNKSTDLIKSVELVKSREESLKHEIESKEEIVAKLRKDQENSETVVAECQVKMKKLDDIAIEREERMKELTYENEKLTWERDEMNESVSDLEKQLLEMKTMKCDIEFQKVQYEEELSRVKERLEYLESSDNDIIEIKDMLEKLQEERENIIRENEKLQCSLSAQIEENEKLLETMECLHKENATFLEKIEVSSVEIRDLSKELAESKLVIGNYEDTLKEVTSEKESQESRFESEIEGLLEENSTLKTNVQMKNVECETLKADNERLQSFFPNIDQESENNSLLKMKNLELEEREKELGKENEHLIAELMETQSKVAEIAEENELLLDKCEEFQRIIGELDDEKTSLLESVERTRLDINDKLKENDSIIEKYENQLECLDQENSTLKTQILSLHQEIEDNLQTENENAISEAKSLKREKEILQQENQEYKEKMNGLEQDLLGLVEQVKLYEATVTEKEDVSLRLEGHIQELLQENAQLKEKYVSIETDFHDLKNTEIYLKEQMKVYESALNSEGGSSGQEVDRLNAQLELERKYKAKFEKDLKHAQNRMNYLENEYKDMKDKNDLLEKELKLAVDKNNEAEKIACKMNGKLNNALLDKQDLMNEKCELQKSFNEVSKRNEVLKVEVCTLQNHLQAVSDNRNHVRNQIEILAAEVEHLRDTNALMQAHDREISTRYTVMISECNTLSEKMSLIAEENEKLQSTVQKLEVEIEDNKCADRSVEDSIRENLSGITEEVNELRNENESLTLEIKKLKVELTEKEEMCEATNELLIENETLTSENEDLKQQNDELKSNFQCLREKLVKLDELIERNKAAELDNDALVERLDVLHKKISEIQKEKQSLQVMTDDLTTMLHDMQTKYEEVKSEMESTKKKCDKEINHLQNQLHEMNEDVSELRKMLDYMENEMYNNAEEKNILKENLEQQQSQFAEVCEQKQKLEEILSDKQQKDLKNMQMASQRHKNNELNTSRNEQDLPCSEQSTLQDDGNQPGAREISDHPLTEVLRDSMDSDLSDILPSFESALHLFGLASSGETVHSSRMVQTNISVREGENIGFLLDDTENDKEFVKKDIETQTETPANKTVKQLSLEVFPNIDIDGIDLELPLNQSPENEISHANMCTSDLTVGDNVHLVSYNCSDRNENIPVLLLTPEAHRAEMVTYTEETVDMYKGDEMDVSPKEMCHSSNQTESQLSKKCDIASQVEFQRNSVSCQIDIPFKQSSENTRLLSFVIDNDENTLDTFPADISVLSADSGILSACAGADGKNQPFQYPGNNFMKNSADVTVQNLDQNKTNDFGQIDKVDGNDHDHIAKEIQFSEICIQTDISFEGEVEIALANLKENVEAEFKEKSKELETDIETRVLKNMEFREKKIQLLEESYDKKVKQMEYDIEEKYEHKFRMREVEIVMEADRDKKAQAAEVKNAAEIEIEKIKREKDQQFVETLQKVKADLAKQQGREAGVIRAVSHDSPRRKSDLEMGPSGDVKKQHEGTFHKLAQEHEELALERDALLEKIKVTQTEQEILCQQLVGIMGEHSTMGNDKQQKYQQTPSWLDWDLHPDFSFGSMRSSLDTKSLSGSLDTSSFCSNSDCLNVRMKYEHLIDKIQQFLKVRSSHVQIDGTEPVKTRAVDDGDVEDSDTQAEGGDRFEENDEPESQMLHRITSIDLETFVRIPKTAEKKSVDQFVYEADDPSSTVELNRDIIDRLVKDSNDSKMEQFNIEGRFSENEESDDENEGDMLDNTEILHKVNQGRSSVSFVEDDGHFYQEDSFQLMRKKRHFSDSDIKGDEKNSKIQTSQSENNEGHFVFERLDSQVEKHKTGKDDVYAAESVDDDDDDDVDDGVFKELEENNITKLISAPVVSTGIQSAKELKMKVDQFINENNDDKPPGSQEVVISARSEPRTGEETGDFFEEKIVKSVVLSQSAVRNKDATAKSETSRQDLKNVEQNLENDLSSVKQEYRHGQQSYENTVFDILNSICPGTDPGRRPGTSAVTEDTFHPVKREQENTVDEFSESSSSVETDMQSLKAELSNMKLELISLTKENSQLKDAMKVKELGNKKDVEVLVEQISELEEINRQQVSDMLQAGREFESQKLDAEQFRNLEQANKDLSVELDKCRELVTCLELDLKQNSNDSQELETLKNELGEERSEKMILKTQYIQMEKMKNESEQKYFEVSSHNDKLISDFRMLDSSVKTLETDMLLLEEEKSKLVNENDSLKSMNENNSKLLQKHEELKMNVTQLQNEKEYLDAELKKKTTVFQVEKDELEKTLIAQSDMNDRLEKSVKVMDIDNKKLKEHLETVIKENETLKEKMEIEVNENMSLKKELEKEISMKMEIKVKEEELNSELFALKHELDIKYTGLISENEKLKVTADEASANINVLKEEKEELNNIIQNIKIKENEKEMLLQDKDIIIAELNQSKQGLIEQVEKLKVNTEALQANCNEMTEKVIELEKENDVLHSCEVESSALKKINEDLRNELIKITERSEENEWAIRELTEQVENQKKPEMTERSTEVDNMEEIAENKSKTLSTEKGAFSFSQQNGSNICLVESFTNTDSCSGNEIEEVTALKEEVGALTSENSTLKQKMKEMSISDNFKEELESLKLENETLKRSLEFAMVKDDSDTDLQIFEDMKDAIKTMQAEKSSVEQHEKEMSDNMEQENKRLRDEVEELYVENDELKKKLKSQEESARKENGEILKMYSDLRNEVEILVISKHDLEIELHALKDLLEHDSYSTREKTEHDTSRELTLEDLEEMEELKTSIEKLKSDLKEKDIYVKKLEEHFLNLDGNMPDLTSTPKPSSSRGMPLISKSFMKRGHYWSSGSSRRAYSHDIPTVNVEKEFNENSIKPDLERSQTLDTSLHVGDLDRSKNSERNFNEGLRTKEKLTSSTLTDSLDRSSYLGSVGGSERIRSGLKAEEDGHLALELKQFELVAEITKLRRDFRETKSLYSKETALLTEALEKEKLANELRGMSELTLEHSVGSNLSHDVLKLRKEVARLREQNKLLHLDCDRWIERLKEQEQIVADLKERINQNTSGYGEIEEVFGRQLALLQKQREELIDKLKDREKENISLSETLGEKGILEETLRKEKDVLVAKLKEKEKIEEELCEKKMLLEKQTAKQKELEDVVYQKDLNEIELMKQKRILEEDLREIESRFRDKEENLDFEKNKLLNELREKRTKSIRSRFSESDDEVSSVCSESAAFSDRNIGRLEVMLEEVEKQHSVAVNVLRDQLRVKYNRREKELRKEHLVGLERLKQDSRKQLESLRGQYENQLDSLRTEIDRSRERRNSKEDDGSGGAGQARDVRQQYQQVKEELGQSLPGEQKDKLDSLVSGMDEQYQAQLEDMHRQHVDDVDEQVKSMRSTLEEIYSSQLEIVRSEMEQSHQTAILDLRETLDKDHKEELNRLEQEWNDKLEQLKLDYETDLKESKVGDAIIIQTIEAVLPAGKEDSAAFISKLNKKLTEEHRQIIQKIEADLDNPISQRHSQDSQTESEENISVASVPVTKAEYKHVEEKQGVLVKADDVQKSLDRQVEEISALRAQMLGEYEQMLSVRAEVMASQSEEVGKLQQEMAQIQSKYEEQMAEFQAKVQSQTETALKSAHEIELEEMKQYYEAKVSDMEQSYTTDIAQLKQEHAELLARLQQESGTGSDIPSPQQLSAGQHREYVRRTTMLTAISDEDETPESTPPGGNQMLEGRIKSLEEKLKDKEKLVNELKKRLEAEATSAEDLHGKLLDSNKTLDDFEESLKSKSDEIEELKKLLTNKDEQISELENEKAALEEKGEKDKSAHDVDDSKIINELRERIKKLEEDLSASKDANVRIQQELNELDAQHGEAIMRLKEQMEILNKTKIAELEAGFQIQLEEELSQQADELDNKYREELSRQTTEELEIYKKTELDLKQKLQSTQKEHENQIKELKEKYETQLHNKEIHEQKIEVTEVSETQVASPTETVERDVLEAAVRKDIESKILQEYEQSIDTLKHEYEERISELNARLQSFESQDVEKAEVSDKEKDVSDSEESEMREKLRAELAFEFKDKLQTVTDEYESKLKELQDIVDSKKEMKSPGAPYALSRSRSLDLMPQKEKEKPKMPNEYEGYVSTIRREYEDKINSLQMQIAQYRSTVGSVPSSPLSTLQKSQAELAAGDSVDKTEIQTEHDSGPKILIKSELGTPELRQEIYDEISTEFEASFKGLRADYEKRLEELTAKLELLQSDSATQGSYENRIMEEVVQEYEAKIEKLKQEYGSQIAELKIGHETEIKKLTDDLEKAKSDKQAAEKKVKADMFVWHEEIVTQLKRKHEEYESQLRKEYEEKMDLYREELQEGFDAEKDNIIRDHKQELIDLEDRYDNLVEGLRTGEVPEVAEIVQQKFDMELEMAKTLIQQECDETIEAEQTRLSEQFDTQLKDVIIERDRELENQRVHYEKELTDLRNTLLQQYESQVVELESQHKAEIMKMKAEYKTLFEETEIEEKFEKETVKRQKSAVLLPQASFESTKTEEGEKEEESEKVTSPDSTSDKSDKDDDDDDKGDGKGGAKTEPKPSQSEDTSDKHEQERQPDEDHTEPRDDIDDTQDEVSETMVKEVKVARQAVQHLLAAKPGTSDGQPADHSTIVNELREELAAKIVQYESVIAQMKLSHEEEVRQLTEELTEAEANYQQKVSELEESHEQEVKQYQESIQKLREGMADEDDSEALELAHQQELQDLEERLLQKHMNELNNLETQHQSRLDDMAEKYRVQVEELQKDLTEARRAMEQYPDSVSPVQAVPVFHGGSTMGSTRESTEDFMVPTGHSQTESERSESQGGVGTMETQVFEARNGEDRSEEDVSQGGSLQGTLEEVGVQSLDTSMVDTSMDQSRGTLRGVDTTQDTELIQFSEEDESDKSMEEGTETQKSDRSTPVALMQTLGYGAEIPGGPTVKSLDDTTDSSIRASDREETAARVKELEGEVEELRRRLQVELSKQDDQMERMDREKQEESNLAAMLRGDIERLNSDREALQNTNEQLLGLLSDAVKTYMGVEESITKKMKVMMDKSGDKSVEKGRPGSAERKKTPPPGRRSPATSPGRVSPARAEDGDNAQDTSIVSNVTDEGLDLSQHISDSIFQGPELKSEEEELLADSGSRLRSSVTHLLDVMEETTNQLLETRQSQAEIMETLEGKGHDLEQLNSRCDDLAERLKEEVERKDFLALELHKAEGLIEGYSSERESQDERIHELEEDKETLVLELETTKNKLLDLESMQTENTQLKKEMDEQRELMTHNVGEEAQGFNRYQYVIIPIGVAIGCLFLHDLFSR